MPARRIPSLAAAGFLLVAGLALAGCSGASEEEPSPAASSSSAPAPSESEESTGGVASADQTVAEACGVLETGLQDIQSGLTENLSTFQSDPGAASAALEELAVTFSANVDGVSNPDIAAVAGPAETALTSLTEQFSALAADPASADVEALTRTATEVQTTFTALGEACV